MALSSALFSGISGLSTLGNAMQIIGDNIANVNTVGFKNSTFTFQDLLSQSTSTMSGTSQVGRGTALGDIYSSFEQGSFESTGNTTDLAVGGEGFFVIRESASDNLYYTRAGNFRFDKDGYLINPEGYVVQGWELDEDGEDIGSIEDILLSSFTSPPSETDTVKVIVNLDSDGDNNTAGVSALSGEWDGTAETPLGESTYEYQTTMKVYDSLGSTHDVTIYFDKADTASAYEYIVTCNPDEDLSNTGVNAGMLARGTVQFSTGSGVITDVTMSTMSGDAWSAGTMTDGYFTFGPEFISGTPMDVALDFGSRFDGSAWVNGSLSTTQFARASTTTFQSANGYGAGDLQGVNVDVDGIITGTYSNGQLLPLYRVALAKFTNEQGLYKEGGNLFKSTRESGDAITNRPGTNGLGSIAPNSLEQSNVDMATEFVKMISTQRGFQANSKIITVVDSMLQELINLKR
ncbi:MAG: flagellar biosynthesis protein FlgE [Deltaproteobacteria bacterium HGW-Deltaproteobacteria-15]|jgi:flagellar hook protein FlgE|nr:MAG: flagellar biosynthesis protein FlgE [Deltaproteobacteria bacterium HGW-Deltaproteobacteria-15]